MRLARPHLSLRAKLALVSLALLALPWFGYRYVREMERFLLEGQQQTLLGMARAVATALHDRPQLLDAAAQPGPADPAAEDTRQKAEDLLLQLALEPQQQAAESAMPAAPRVTPPIEYANGDSGQSQEIASILKGLERSTARIWVVNRRYRLLALTGSLKRPAPQASQPSLSRRMVEWLIPPPREDFDEAAPDDLLATGKEIANALQGLPGTRLRNSRDDQAVIVSAAYPIWSGDEVLGAVVAEESTNSILSVRNRALERLLLITLAVFAVAAAVLMWFAFRVSSRIRQLRDEAETAIDARGRIARLLSGSQAGDEIGDLSRSFSAVLSRLSQQQAYLESLASRLSHELRTPVAVVRSSLENLRQTLAVGDHPEESGVYIARAEEGLARLSAMLNRMTEATRLEQSLQAVERERFDLAGLVAGCVQGYRSAYAQARFEFAAPAEALMVKGSPELMAQLLDKLVANAVDFAQAQTPIVLGLQARGGMAELSVANQGPALPEEGERLFSAMVSVRKPSGEAHLGLGLYVARLIAEFHGGSIAAANAPQGGGVVVTVRIPLVQ